ncbi:MAG: methyltransferase domain-containing protein [Armatimonadetes bacterium]|nr:methyltransferase domain-containing protein [Armatimonadota bacterium]
MNEMDDIEMWDAAAEPYDAAVDDNWRQCHITNPALFQLLDQVEDQDILDAGCGPGWLSVEIARRGARVVGIDAAEQMILRARERAKDAPQNIRFMQADLCSPLPLQDHSFDGVVANMVLMDIPEIDRTLAEFRRVLRPAGRLVLSITHPCFFMWNWKRDAAGNKLWKPVDDYLTVRSEVIEIWGPTRHYHRPLSWYFDVLASVGYVVDMLLEPTPDFERSAETGHVWRIPDIMVIRAVPWPSS